LNLTKYGLENNLIIVTLLSYLVFLLVIQSFFVKINMA